MDPQGQSFLSLCQFAKSVCLDTVKMFQMSQQQLAYCSTSRNSLIYMHQDLNILSKILLLDRLEYLHKWIHLVTRDPEQKKYGKVGSVDPSELAKLDDFAAILN